MDETGFSATPDNRYAWTKIGDVHAVDAVRLKRVNVMGCLLSTGHLITSCLQVLCLFDGCSSTGETQLSSSFGVDC